MDDKEYIPDVSNNTLPASADLESQAEEAGKNDFLEQWRKTTGEDVSYENIIGESNR